MGWFNRKNKKVKEDRDFRKWEREQLRSIREEKNKLEMLRIRAKEREQALDYSGAAKIWDQLGEISEAARVRRIMLNENKVDQTVVHGDYVDDRDTIVKDSVVNRSNIGAGSDDKFARLEKLTKMKEKGLIDDSEFKQMKKEILGK
tara:strand:- start:21 stop:458 length:438 start_codon:yes stop_codon:yes gene_type:complete